MLSITEQAVTAAIRLRSGLCEEKEDCGLRIKVEGGGCSGFQYNLSFDWWDDSDVVFWKEDFPVITDKRSFLYIAGSDIDYDNSLMGNGFSVSNPKANSTCGCGESFSV